MAYCIVAQEGFDIYDDGPIKTEYPWRRGGTNNIPTITSGMGAFESTKGLTFNTGTGHTVGAYYTIPNLGTYGGTNGSAASDKHLFGLNFWIRINSVLPSLSNTAILGRNNTRFQYLGISNNASEGLSLLFPTTMNTTSGVTSAPLKMSIELNQYYWVSLRFSFNNGEFRGSYAVNGIVVFDDVVITPNSSNYAVTQELCMYGNNAQFNYSLDDLVIQSSNGSLMDWPAGFIAGVPNKAQLSDLNLVSPRRIFLANAISNGSVNEWESSNPELQNFEAVTSEDAFVEALNSDQTDLYKFQVDNNGVTVNDVLAVTARFNSNKYRNVEPSVRGSVESPIIHNPGVSTKGAKLNISVQETAPDGTKWTVEKIEQTEFGQHSL